MKKILFSLSIIATFIAYTLYQRDLGTANVQNNNPVAQQVPRATTPAATQSKLRYKDGEYTGIVADAFYGNVQVKATIKNNAITNVQALDYPHEQNTSIEINSQAIPNLVSEAIQVQNANVDIVSGATQTSRAFIQSLGSALAKAAI